MSVVKPFIRDRTGGPDGMIVLLITSCRLIRRDIAVMLRKGCAVPPLRPLSFWAVTAMFLKT